MDPQFYIFLMLSVSNKYPECRSFLPDECPTGRPEKEYSYSGHGWVSRKSLGTDGRTDVGAGYCAELCVCSAVLPGCCDARSTDYFATVSVTVSQDIEGN